jgi:hypothetical protein
MIIKDLTIAQNRLIAAAICLGTAFLSALPGCTPLTANVTGLCRNSAPYCAQLLDETTQCEVVCGITVDNINHCQARCLLDGQVKWVSRQNERCVSSKVEHPFAAGQYRAMSVAETAKYLQKWFPSIGRNINETMASLEEHPRITDRLPTY